MSLPIWNPWAFADPETTQEEPSPVIQVEQQPSPTSHLSTKTWIEQQQDLALKGELPIPSSLSDVSIPEQEPISLFQQFRALTPRSSTSFKVKKPELVTIPVPEIKRDSIASTASVTSRMSRIPPKARHQAIAINNIAKLFSDLLTERESLVAESEELESKRVVIEDELRQVEEILTSYTIRKKNLMDEVKQIVKREDKVSELLDQLDDRISSIGDQTVKVEKTIRSIKGDSAMLNVVDEEPAPNSCIKTLYGHLESVECLDFETPYGYLVSGSADKMIRVWDISNHKCVGVLDGHTGWVRAVQMSGYNVISGSGDHTAKLWDISKLSDSGQELIEADDNHDPLVRSFYGHTGGVTCLQFNNQFLLTGSVDKTIRQWDLETGATLGVLRSEMSLESLDTSMDQALYAELRELSSSPIPTEPEFHVWTNPLQPKVSTTSKIFNMGGHVGGIHFYQYALAAGYGDGVIRLFDLRSGECHRALSGHYGTVTTVSFDDNVIISGSMDKSVKIWDIRMGDVIRSMSTKGNVTDFAFDYSRIVVACSKKAISIFNRSTGHVTELEGHSKPVRSVRAIANRLVSGSMDGSIRVWHSEPLHIVV